MTVGGDPGFSCATTASVSRRIQVRVQKPVRCRRGQKPLDSCPLVLLWFA